MARKEIEDFAKKNGFIFRAEADIEIDEPLTDEGKIKMGKEQAQALVKLRELDYELAEVKSDFKARIEKEEGIIQRTSKAIISGKQTITRRLPAFIDRKGMLCMVDMSTGEVVFTRPTTPEERQGSLA